MCTWSTHQGDQKQKTPDGRKPMRHCGSLGDERVQKAQPHAKGPHIPQTINHSHRFVSRRQDEQAKISQCRRQDEQLEEIKEPKWWKST